jgi:hypothetical protein
LHQPCRTVWRNEHRIGVTFVEGRIVPRPAQQSAGGALLIGGRRQQRPSNINFGMWSILTSKKRCNAPCWFHDRQPIGNHQ